MANTIETDKGFLVIEMSKEEAKRIGFGIPNKGCLCMNCNNFIDGNVYYIAVLNDVMCKECYSEYVTKSKYYPEDVFIEDRNFKHVINLLNSDIEIEPQYPQIIEL